MDEFVVVVMIVRLHSYRPEKHGTCALASAHLLFLSTRLNSLNNQIDFCGIKRI